jgi:hypothetical protein
LRLRPTTRADADGLLAFFARLSGRSAYQRFHGARWIDRALVENLLDPDWQSRGVLVERPSAKQPAQELVAA